MAGTGIRETGTFCPYMGDWKAYLRDMTGKEFNEEKMNKNNKNANAVANFIERKSLLYETGVEYGDYAINHVQGCAHGCRYPCYAFLMKRRFGVVKDMDDWTKPAIVSNALELLDEEIPRLKSKIKSVQLCFSTDPFMFGYPQVAEMSCRIIEKLNESGIKCIVLTKGHLPITLSLLSNENEYGITLVSLSEDFREKYEPFTAQINDRIAALRHLSERGCKTWVSIEPYPPPKMFEQDFSELLERIDFADKIIFGGLNYNKSYPFKENEGFYATKADELKSFCGKYDIECVIKNKIEGKRK